MSFFMKLTTTGAAKLAAAESGGPQINLTEIAIGDGNGNPVAAPTGGEETLVREVYRDQIAALYTNPNDDTIFIAEMTIPTSEGGWVMREIALFDVDGDLFAYGNFPETYKAVATEGTAREMVVVAAVKVSNADNIQLVIDGNVVLASRDWVLNTVTPGYLLPGGLTNEVLAKASNADGDLVWVNIANGVPVVVDVIKEVQALADAQTVVTFSTVSTEGLAVYVEGLRLVADHDYTVDSQTQITLAQSYPAGSTLHAYQNDLLEPPTYLVPALNLSDVPDKAAARKNLGVASEADLYFYSQF